MGKVRNELLPLIDMNEVLYPGKSALGNDEQRWIVKWTDVLPAGHIVQPGIQ